MRVDRTVEPRRRILLGRSPPPAAEGQERSSGVGGRVPVSDRGHSEVYHNFYHDLRFRADPLARKPLIPKTRRDVRVVEGARLESELGHDHQAVPNTSLRSQFSDLPPQDALRCAAVNNGIRRRF